MRTIAAIVAIVLAVMLGGPIVQAVDNWNDYSQAQRQLELERQRWQDELERQRAAAEQPGVIAASYSWRVLSILAAAVALMVLHDSYQKRQRRVDSDRALVYPDARGMLPVTRAELERAELAEIVTLTLASYHERQLAEAQRTGMLAQNLTWAPKYSGASAATAEAPALAAEPAAPQLPGPVDMAELLSDFKPSTDRILLGLGPSGQHTAPVSRLMHIAFLGATGGGKSNLMRLTLAQLLAIGAHVILVDPHFAAVDPESGDDWRPIAERLHMAPASSAGDIRNAVAWVKDELDARLERRRRMEPIGPPMFLAYDELPSMIRLAPEAPEQLGRVLREGRKVKLFCVGASQEFLIKIVGGSSGARDQYRTAFYVGGDKISASALLDIPQRSIDDAPLGAGIAMLRSAATPEAQLVRIPLASNTAIEQLLSPAYARPISGRYAADERPMMSANAATLGGENRPGIGQKSAEAERLHSATASAEALRAARLFMEGLDPSKIVQELRGISSKQGAKYQQALAEIHELIRDGVQA